MNEPSPNRSWYTSETARVYGSIPGSLPLISHPHPLPRIPLARAMEQKKGLALLITVLLIQFCDPLLSQPQQWLVFRKRFLVRVSKIRQQAKGQILVAIRQKADFKRLDQFLDALGAGEHCRDHDQSARFRGNTFGEVHSRQRMRRHQ